MKSWQISKGGVIVLEFEQLKRLVARKGDFNVVVPWSDSVVIKSLCDTINPWEKYSCWYYCVVVVWISGEGVNGVVIHVSIFHVAQLR